MNINSLESQSSSDQTVIQNVIIDTTFGKLLGSRHNVSGNLYNQFLSIPYAQPPINKLRFKKPEPLSSGTTSGDGMRQWDGIREANRWPPFCTQINLKQYEYLTKINNYDTQEDCLYLNIWTPSGGDLPKNLTVHQNGKLLPVIVYIHGGVFVYMGTSFDIFNGGLMASLGQLVFVSFNYRLGIFGFLDTGADDYDNDDDSGGNDGIDKNVGFYDQILALNWVKQNIRQFGGDPDSITLMGQSAGAISIGLLMAAPEASHLFHRAILESSSPMQMKFFYEISGHQFPRILQLTNCGGSGRQQRTVSQQYQCLRQVSAEDLNKIHEQLMTNTFMSFSPTIPSRVLPQFPREAFDPNLADNGIRQKQVLIGGNADEGTLFLHQIRPIEFPLDTVPDIRRETVSRLLADMSSGVRNLSDYQLDSLVDRIVGTDGSLSPEQLRHRIAEVIGDFLFKGPVIKFADSLSDWPNITVYMYYFTQRSGLLPEWIGSSHFEECQYVFGLPLRYPQMYGLSTDDSTTTTTTTATTVDEHRAFSRRLIETWSHFAKTGHMSRQLGSVWPRYRSGHGVHLELNARKVSYGTKLNNTNYQLFDLAFESMV
ncbi:cholinesterase-like [Oppia nitens]|uniref:cholinesterase-like n=1 Tax=Oppia nitens TaxID=1686743 RepID=UPI0023DBB1A7|nr:cholinesterase-like [Oppia nitens]